MEAHVSCKVVLANSIAKSLLAEVSEGQTAIGRRPHLVGFLANADPAAQMYAEWTAKTCNEKCVPPSGRAPAAPTDQG